MIRLPSIPIRAKFPPGQIAITRGAIEALVASAQEPAFFVNRHLMGDWGGAPARDREANARAVVCGGRIISTYLTLLGSELWIITEADRRATTLLLPEEY